MAYEHLIIDDQRAEGDSSLEYYPRMTTYDQVDAVFGLDIFENFGWSAVKAGELCWRLVGFNVRTGAAIFFPRVLGLDGQPYWHTPTDTGALVFHTWPGAPDFTHPSPLRPDYNETLRQHYGDGEFKVHHALSNWTKQENGYADFAYGGEMASGNGAIWVSAVPEHVPAIDGSHYSDCVGGLNWIGGTDHLTASPVFQLTRKEGGGGTPPPDGNVYLVNLDETGKIVEYIEFVPGAPAAGVRALGLAQDEKVTHHVPWKRLP
jgi:hypothetical protein